MMPPAMAVRLDTLLQNSARLFFQPAESRIAKSPASCGTSWAMIAAVVDQPSSGSARKAAAMSRPSVKLWKLSPM